MSDSVSQVVKEIIDGDSLTTSQAARLRPAHRGDGRANPSSIWRLMRDGVRGPAGTIVKLESAKFGNTWLTSRAALARFMMALSGQSTSPDAEQPAPTRTTTARQKSSQRASAKLAAMGA
jgi:hypothetical protein